MTDIEFDLKEILTELEFPKSMVDRAPNVKACFRYFDHMNKIGISYPEPEIGNKTACLTVDKNDNPEVFNMVERVKEKMEQNVNHSLT